MKIDRQLFRQADFIQTAIRNVSDALRDGAILVAIILFAFLLNLRTTLISLAALPVSLIVSVLAMRAAGVTINTMTLGGLTIAIGALVDDAIIDVENVFRRLRQNGARPEVERRPALEVIYEASREVRGTIVFATLIVMLVFVPIFFLSGVIDERGRISQKYANPFLRDNEWVVTNEIDRAHQEKRGLVILGIRRFAKSVIEASYIAWGATFDENSQNIIAGLNAPDIKLITDKIDKGLNFLPEAWRWQRIEDNWKNQVTLGIKTKAGERIPFSKILVKNLDEGNNEEAIAGTKPRKLIIDEIGKGSFLRGFQAAVPGFTTPFGWGCSAILTGTGGDMKTFLDAKSLMFDVDNLTS